MGSAHRYRLGTIEVGKRTFRQLAEPIQDLRDDT